MKRYAGLWVTILVIGVVCGACSPSSHHAPAPAVEEQQPAGEQQTAQEPAAEQPAAEPVEEVAAADPNTWEAWFVGKAEWVGSKKEFKTSMEEGALPDGTNGLKAKTSVGDDRVRDLYLAYTATGLQAGKNYKISLDYQFGAEEAQDVESDPYISMQNAKTKNYIQYAVKDGDQRNHDAIAAIEDYPDRPVPETKYVDSATFGDGEFHKLEVEHTLGEGQSSLTFMMIVRFRAKSTLNNELLFGNLSVSEAAAQ